MNDLAITPDGSKLITACQEKKIRIFDLTNFQELGDLLYSKDEKLNKKVVYFILKVSSKYLDSYRVLLYLLSLFQMMVVLYLLIYLQT